MKQEANDPRAILRARARALAKVPATPAEAGAGIDVVEFRLAQETYAVESAFVTEIFPLKDLTPLPGTPPFLRGIINVRGRILPVLDLKRFFDLPEQGLTDLHRVILVEGFGLELGLLADLVTGLRTVPPGSLQPTLPTLTGIRGTYLKGVTTDRLVVLDLSHILTDPKILVDEEVRS